MLKRKDSWVSRFVLVDGPNRTLYYKNSQADKHFKFCFDLAGCTLMRHFRDKDEKEPYIILENKMAKPAGKEKIIKSLSICFETDI